MVVEFRAFLLFLGAALLVAITPGPGYSTLRHEHLQATVRMVWHRAWYRWWNLVHVLAGAVGISALIMASAEGFTLLKLAGAVCLIWHGFKTWNDAGIVDPIGWR